MATLSLCVVSLFEKWSERKREKLRALLHYFHTVTDPGTLLPHTTIVTIMTGIQVL